MPPYGSRLPRISRFREFAFSFFLTRIGDLDRISFNVNQWSQNLLVLAILIHNRGIKSDHFFFMIFGSNIANKIFHYKSGKWRFKRPPFPSFFNGISFRSA